MGGENSKRAARGANEETDTPRKRVAGNRGNEKRGRRAASKCDSSIDFGRRSFDRISRVPILIRVRHSNAIDKNTDERPRVGRAPDRS
ncbi:hypothetical protein WS68_12450 [Burkholderia sp. TSV86]|nr:hypothetical protein WS68_12450 [Burkholderia sp. TSV86]